MTLPACLVALTLLASSEGAEEPLHLGGDFSIAVATPIEEIVSHPESYHGRCVRTTGIVASACTEEGCFIEVVPRGGGAGIVANFPGLVHTFPIDCAGREATVEGIVYRKIYDTARVSHWQHHSYHPGAAIPGFSMILRMEVTSAEIAGSRAPIPTLAPIREVKPHSVDLDREEFEHEGFGIGKKHLDPGTKRRQTASRTTRAFVVCLEGSLSVTREDAPSVRLEPGCMTYLPPSTSCELVASDAGADVLIIYSSTPSQESEHKH